MRIGFLGPAGTFSEQALLSEPSVPRDAELVPLATVHQVVVAVADGDVDRALAPIENSLEGSVNEAVDAVLTIAPLPWAAIWRNSCVMQSQVPVKTTSRAFGFSAVAGTC